MWYRLLCTWLLVFSAHGATVPFDLPQFQPVLSQCRLHCPATSPAIVSNGRFDGFSIPNHFYLDGTYMVLGMDKDTGNRCELRHNIGWSTNSTDDVAQTYTSRMRLTTMNNTRSVTIMQIHSKRFLHYRTGPPLMLGWHSSRSGISSNLWVKIRMDLSSTSKKLKYFDLDLDPALDFFDLQVTVWKRVLYVFVNGVLKLQHDWSYLNLPENYFKTGVYVHRPQTSFVHFNDFVSLSMGADEGFSDAETATDTPTLPPTLPPTTLAPTDKPTMLPTSRPSLRPSTAAPSVANVPRITAVYLVDAEQNEDLRVLTGDVLLDSSNLPAFSIRAEAANVGSVIFVTNGRSKTENISPYVISGDKKGHAYPWNVSPGHYDIVMSPYSERRGQGTKGHQ